MTTDEKPPDIVTFGVPVRFNGREVTIGTLTVMASSDDPDDDTYTIIPPEIAELLNPLTCIESASCEEGDHSYSWPCDLVYVPRDDGLQPWEEEQ